MSKSKTLVSLFCDRVAQEADQDAIWVKRSGQFTPTTWGALANDVRRLAAALRNLGVEPGDRVVQVSENRYEWIVCDLAVQMARAVHVPIHATLAAPQIALQIVDSGTSVVFLSTAEQAKKIAGHSDSLTGCEFVAFQSIGDSKLPAPAIPFADLIAAVDFADADAIELEALEELAEDDLATMIYTSGTTGQPKGVMLSHKNLVSNTLGTLEAFAFRSTDMRLTFLPLSHIFARTCDLYSWIALGSKLALAENRETILADCGTSRPTVLNGVPYFYDKVVNHLQQSGQADDPQALYSLLGGEIRLCCSGGAALAGHVERFFERHGLPLLQGYGLTETSPVISVSTIEAHKVGSVGRPIPGVEVKTADDGEILTRGPHVMVGYYRQDEETRQTVRDGWLCTGDLGNVDPDGFLWITGRKKELIVTSVGKNIAPVALENRLIEDPFIHQAIVIGNDRSYITALIVPEAEALRAEIVRRKIRVFSPAAAVAHADVVQLYRDRIDQQLSTLSHDEQVRKFTILTRGFTIEQDELTPTLKLRRSVIEEHFAKEIAAMYQ